MAQRKFIEICASILPKKLRILIAQIFFIESSVLLKFFTDLFYYWRYSRTFSHHGLKRLEYELVVNYHVIEKGLSLAEIKPNFGQPRIYLILRLLDEFLKNNYDRRNFFYVSAVTALKEYVAWHKSIFVDVSWLEKELARHLVEILPDDTSTINKDEYFANARGNFKDLVYSRKSIRNYTAAEADLSLIKQAIDLAHQAPSACNRQPAKAYIVCDKNKIFQILKLQSGNRGFENNINKLIIVTADLGAYRGTHELNAGFVDGSLFGMTLVYALHYYGLGACILNWFTSITKDRLLHKILNISFREKIIFLIAVGVVPDNFQVAKSKRKDFTEVYKVID